MYILGIRIHASNDALVKIWAVALALILAVAAFLTWSNRFRETVETSIARISPFGIEVAGTENANFTGKRGFFSKMNQMGLPPATRKAELAALFEELEAAGAGAFADVPVLWIYAEGRTKEDRDRCVQTFGKVFFDRERFCYSVVDGNGFSVQLDPDTFRVLWAKDGGAVCAFPLLQLPPDCAERGFLFRIEERASGNAWKLCGEIAFPPLPPPEYFSPGSAVPEPAENEADAASEDVREPDPAEIEPAAVSVESLAFPQRCRFFSALPRDRAAFGEIRVRIEGNASGKVPAAAWTLDNFALRAPHQAFPMTRADAFHKNMRFLEKEIFESDAGGVLRVPVAKTLFPSLAGNGEAQAWRVDLRLVRGVYFPEDLQAFPSLRVGKNDSVLPETLAAKGSTAKVRAFRRDDYFRLLNNKMPAVVLEVEQPHGDDEFSWAPYRVKTDAGEDLFPESLVNVRPGVRQYWFLPHRGVPAKIDVVFAVTRCVRRSAEIVPAAASDAPAKTP